MIFSNPSGAPELACDECGCRWFDRMHDRCYECGAPVSAAAMEAFREALQEWGQSNFSGTRGRLPDLD
ncbi:MAG: cysteine protease [Betaproteobacteria bacterium RIFCSPLOWO2_02_67_12]|nr:MAG: cysteine protease [Betaproteobacteria bacterium RIFCSPLOWO2_02_67_12]OGA71474.1 MAG: cysteine protease [Betaproteobacteria bacterium RIFCSPLOWO2_12_FULL_67_28]